MKTNTMVGVVRGNKAGVLNDLGTRLAEIITKQRECRAMVERLWQVYLMDCHRNGVQPLTVEGMPTKPHPFPCPLCSRCGGYANTAGGHFSRPRGYNCAECGRHVCHHYREKGPLCPECSEQPAERNHAAAE